MTITRGESWGTLGPAPDGLVVVRSDAAARATLLRHRAAGQPVPPLALLGGDLMRAVGGTGDESRLAGDVARLPVDVVRAGRDDGGTTWFVAHLVARGAAWRGSWWRGEVLAAVNGQFVGSADAAPRAHPNDGHVDVVHVGAAMTPRQRVAAARRVPTGTHLPHPSISVRRVVETTVRFERPLRLVVDGEPWGSTRVLHLAVEPDAITVCV